MADSSLQDRNARLRRWATIASVGVAGSLMVAKLVAYLATGSVALLSSLIDSTVDLMASFVTVWGVARAARPPDLAHRYGYGKAEALAALAQAAFIGGSAGMLTYEAINHLVNPEPVRATAIGIGVMGLAIVLSFALVGFQRYVVKRTGSIAIAADSMHYKSDLLMNLAVIAALGLSDVFRSIYIDPVFALIIAVVLFRAGWRVSRDSLGMLMDREVPAEERTSIEQRILADPDVRGLHDLRTRRSGTQTFIEFHLELDGALPLAEAHRITDRVERDLLEAFDGADVVIHQEPAGLVDPRLDDRVRAPRRP